MWNNKEIDIVNFDNTMNNIIFGEYKFEENKVDVNILATFEEKAKYVELNKNNR